MQMASGRPAQCALLAALVDGQRRGRTRLAKKPSPLTLAGNVAAAWAVCCLGAYWGSIVTLTLTLTGDRLSLTIQSIRLDTDNCELWFWLGVAEPGARAAAGRRRARRVGAGVCVCVRAFGGNINASALRLR